MTGNRLYYLAAPPSSYPAIIEGLGEAGLGGRGEADDEQDTCGWARIVVEKPFGHDQKSAAELNRLLKDLPGTFELVDIRPPDQFADYSLPGARNVDMADLLADPAFLTGAGPLILVDRDGSLAMAVGGILCQKTERTVKVLYGGLEAYWRESAFGLPGERGMAPPPSAPSPGTPPAAVPSPPATPEPSKPKKKSAGC